MRALLLAMSLLARGGSLLAPRARGALRLRTTRAAAPPDAGCDAGVFVPPDDAARGAHTWTVGPDAAAAMHRARAPGQFLESPEFACAGRAWTLRLYPGGQRAARAGLCALFLCFRAEDVGDAVDAAFELQLERLSLIHI